MTRRSLLPALGFLLACGTAEARQPLIPPSELPGIGAEDPRRMVDGAAAPWRSLGRVQTEVGGRCTGTLVGPRRVLTAAHCLVSTRSRRLVQPGSVHFLLGYQRGKWAAQARVAGFTVGPGFDPGESGPAEADWAVLELEPPLRGAVPLAVLPSVQAGAAMLGGYQQDRPEVLMADAECRVLGEALRGGRPLLTHDCAGTRGASGAPLLARDAAGGWAVAGIAVAAARGGALGVAVPAWVAVSP
ncbi:trypsin-like serine peptidase [Roseomonas sp. WA12]